MPHVAVETLELGSANRAGRTGDIHGDVDDELGCLDTSAPPLLAVVKGSAPISTATRNTSSAPAPGTRRRRMRRRQHRVVALCGPHPERRERRRLIRLLRRWGEER